MDGHCAGDSRIIGERREMKDREFNHPYMEWSMKDTSIMDTLPKGSTMEEFRVAYGEQELELDVEEGIEDGIYKFVIIGKATVCDGIVVQDGKFEPYMTAHAIYLASREIYGGPHFDHVYIESIKWVGGYFIVGMGS